MFLVRKKSFTLTELLIAMVLTSLVILAVTSVDITSRKFFAAASKEARVQNEAKIAMEHILEHVQLGIGDMSNAQTLDTGTPPALDNSRGFWILNSSGHLSSTGSIIHIKRDGLTGPADGKFVLGDPDDGTIMYAFPGTQPYRIYYSGPAAPEYITDAVITNCTFETYPADTSPNEVKVTIETLHDPSEAEGPDNPKTTLTSSIVLRAMSIN